MTGSCPVGATVCREAHAEVERLRHEVADLRRSRDERKATERARRRADRESFAATMQGELDKANAEVVRLRTALLGLVAGWEAVGRGDSHPLIRGAALSAAGQVRDVLWPEEANPYEREAGESDADA